MRFENGMTIAELKEILSVWPDTHPDGTPCEVWIDTGDGKSNQVKDVSPLDVQWGENGIMTADIILSYDT